MSQHFLVAVRVVTVVASLAAVAMPVSALLQRLDVKDPRQFGYWIGDVVTREVSVAMAPPYTLERSSLPRVGRMDRWLWLREVSIESDSQGALNSYRLTFRYQVLNAPARLRRLFIPQQTLHFSGGGERLPVLIEALGIHVSPLAAPSAVADAGYPDLQPAVPPPPLDATIHQLAVAAAAVGLLLASGLLLYVYGTLPWLRRSRGPFHRALATLKALARERPTEESVAWALRSLHHAFNATAGEVLLSGDLPRFFDRFPGFKAHRDRIEDFFRSSRQWFYDTQRPSAAPPEQLRRLLELCRTCRDIERGLA